MDRRRRRRERAAPDPRAVLQAAEGGWPAGGDTAYKLPQGIRHTRTSQSPACLGQQQSVATPRHVSHASTVALLSLTSSLSLKLGREAGPLLAAACRVGGGRARRLRSRICCCRRFGKAESGGVGQHQTDCPWWWRRRRRWERRWERAWHRSSKRGAGGGRSRSSRSRSSRRGKSVQAGARRAGRRYIPRSFPLLCMPYIHVSNLRG